MAASTTYLTFGIFRSALRRAVRQGLIGRSPLEGVEFPRVPRRKTTILTKTEAQRLLDEVRSHQWETLYCLVLGIGLRRGELLNLRWEDVDVGRGTLRIRQVKTPDIRFHGLRHSCASFLAAEGVHPLVAQKILGHANISTTLDVYTHITDELQRDALAKTLGFE